MRAQSIANASLLFTGEVDWGEREIRRWVFENDASPDRVKAYRNTQPSSRCQARRAASPASS